MSDAPTTGDSGHGRPGSTSGSMTPSQGTSGHGGRRRSGPGGGSMTPSQGTPVAVETSISRRARASIAVFLVGPLIWAVHFMVVYLIAEAGCTGGGPGLRALDPPVPAVVTLAATVVGALACLGCAWWGLRRWQADRSGRGAPADGDASAELSDPDAQGSLSLAGFWMSLLFAVSVLMVGLPAAALGPC